MFTCIKKMRHKLSLDAKVIKRNCVKKKDIGHDIPENTIMYDW